MSDWRYWITYAGTVTADTKYEAQKAALEASLAFYPTIRVEEVEEVGEGE